GEAIAIGWMAEQTSCLKPGRVNALVRVPPPIVSAPSTIKVESPCCCSVIAAANPFGPEPTIMASYLFIARNHSKCTSLTQRNPTLFVGLFTSPLPRAPALYRSQY